jgi:hypothetical protein
MTQNDDYFRCPRICTSIGQQVAPLFSARTLPVPALPADSLDGLAAR